MRVVGVMLFCEDIKGLTTFYRDIVGLEPDDPQPFKPTRFFRFRSENGASLCLHSGTKPNGGRQKLMFNCDDVPSLIERLNTVKRRVRMPEPNADGQVVFDFHDPEGNRIQVYGNVDVNDKV